MAWGTLAEKHFGVRTCLTSSKKKWLESPPPLCCSVVCHHGDWHSAVKRAGETGAASVTLPFKINASERKSSASHESRGGNSGGRRCQEVGCLERSERSAIYALYRICAFIFWNVVIRDSCLYTHKKRNRNSQRRSRIHGWDMQIIHHE